jgi:hypothetical protein
MRQRERSEGDEMVLRREAIRLCPIKDDWENKCRRYAVGLVIGDQVHSCGANAIMFAGALDIIVIEATENGKGKG